MSYHLLGDYDMAQSVLEEFRKTQQDRPAPLPDKPYDNEHSEFLLYQNLILRESRQYEEALENIRNAIKNNITSHVVWHVYGLWQRSERKYDEAIKAYKRALTCEKVCEINLLD